ncbi:MAG: aminoacyl-tRNA hydrolase [Deltaproteobacteria bacterium]|nr:aminoacyl-tRNA hydrolase [Deltaproteobacteria bacterium]
MLFVTPNLSIPSQFLEVRYARSGGPGGQHVNKTETQVDMRLHVGACDVLRDSVKDRLRLLAGNRMTKDDSLQVVCGRNRERLQNQKECEQRLREFILEAMKPPPAPRKKRRVSRAAKRRRVDAKRAKGDKKSSRSKRWRDGD